MPMVIFMTLVFCFWEDDPGLSVSSPFKMLTASVTIVLKVSVQGGSASGTEIVTTVPKTYHFTNLRLSPVAKKNVTQPQNKPGRMLLLYCRLFHRFVSSPSGGNTAGNRIANSQS